VYRILHHGDASPQLLRNDWASPVCASSCCWGPRAPVMGANSHGESAQKTALTGANWDLFWFDLGASAQFREFKLHGWREHCAR
jgi:hypothetical protein